MQYLNIPPAYIYSFIAMQDFRRRSLKKPVSIDIKPFRKVTSIRHICFDSLNRLRKSAVQPVKLIRMRIKIREIPMPADMVPMDVRRNRCYMLIGQFNNFVIYIADPQTRIDQQTPLRPVQQIAMRLLPVPVFTDTIGISVYFIYSKPIAHLSKTFLLKTKNSAILKNKYSTEDISAVPLLKFRLLKVKTRMFKYNVHIVQFVCRKIVIFHLHNL